MVFDAIVRCILLLYNIIMAYKNKEDELKYQKEWQNKRYKSNPLLFNKRVINGKELMKLTKK
jgi:hypothetical protein